ncbi:MAG: hypothetical protein AB7O59_19385 [Pirellulales bacterium]
MMKLFFALAIVTTLSAQSAFARGRCCCGSTSSAPAHVEQSAPEAAPAAPQAKEAVPQAKAPTQNRSFSYEPSTDANNAPVYRTYRYNYNRMPRIEGSYGIRPAGDKLIGNY